MMGAGKTAVGTAVARRLGVPFLDSDREIEKAAQMTIAEIFERDGEAFFRDRETRGDRAAAAHAARASCPPAAAPSCPSATAGSSPTTASRSGCAPTSTCCGRGCGTRRRGRSCARPNPRATLTDALRGARPATTPRPSSWWTREPDYHDRRDGRTRDRGASDAPRRAGEDATMTDDGPRAAWRPRLRRADRRRA